MSGGKSKDADPTVMMRLQGVRGWVYTLLYQLSRICLGDHLLE